MLRGVEERSFVAMPHRTGILIGFLVNNNRDPFRLFFIRVDFKESYRCSYRTLSEVLILNYLASTPNLKREFTAQRAAV